MMKTLLTTILLVAQGAQASDMAVLIQPQDTTIRVVLGSAYVSVSNWDKELKYQGNDLVLEYSKHKLGSLGYHHTFTQDFSILGGAVFGQQKGFNEGVKVYPEIGAIYNVPNSPIVLSISYDSLVQVPVVGVGGRW